MTRRERLERRLEKRQDWADGRDRKADALQKQNERFRGDIAFNTQPGHIPERARAIRRDERAWEHRGVANHHRAKAAGLEAQLERAIFSDDDDAIEKCEERAREFDAEAEFANAVNRAWRKYRNDRPALFEAWESLGASRAQAERLYDDAMQYSWTQRKGPMDPAYPRANARRYRERVKLIRAQAAHQERVEAAGGVLIERQQPPHDWCNVTFSEKPARDVLEALKAAGFRWYRGCWAGATSKLPPAVAEMEAAT